MLKCERCQQETASRININFYMKESDTRHRENIDICINCMLTLMVRLLDRLEDQEKIPFLKQFMEGIII